MENLPGTLWINRGRWNWRVTLPGEDRRRNYPLRLPKQKLALPEERGSDLAESIAWRIWEKATKASAPHDNGMTLDQVVARFLAWAESAYRRTDGTPTREIVNCEIALRSLRAMHGAEPIDNVGYEHILAARDALENTVDGEDGPKYHRNTINQRVGVWKRFVRWALDNRLCSPRTKADWWAMSNLARLRSKALESVPVGPVPHWMVKATLPYVSPTAAAMIRVQELCGARPGEICAMRPCDIERRRKVWVYRPGQHKTLHRDQVRVIVLGPQAQTILLAHLGKRPNWKSDAPMFPPQEIPKRTPARPGDRTSYVQVIRYAVKAARKAGAKSIENWTPNQLRHACGTRVRRRFGADVAGAVLGHTQGQRITDRYTRTAIEAEIISASSRAMIALG